jgi:peptidyl-prolyl cis-trans isomerase A (cyclophilin A)
VAEQIFATLDTNHGRIVAQLYADETPVTVDNFVSLAEGTRTWTDPATGEKKQEPLYNGTIFHRIIPDFMIQGGDPLGRGTGGPGYQFQDEFHPSLKFDRPYLLAMANAGPGTNGSQFFITTNVAHTQHLTGRHTIFGKVIEGTNVVDAISAVPTGSGDRPVNDVVIQSVTIERRQTS